MAKLETKTIAVNKARHDYFVEESFETGIVLAGTEVKSLRAGTVNLKDSWCDIENGEILSNRCTSALMKKGIFSIRSYAHPQLLMHRRKSTGSWGCSNRRVYLDPLSLYFKGSRVKLQLGLCKGKTLRQTGRRRQAGCQTGY